MWILLMSRLEKTFPKAYNLNCVEIAIKLQSTNQPTWCDVSRMENKHFFYCYM